MLRDLVTESREHLAGVDEDYLEHMRFASSVGGILLVAGLCCIIHSLVPALFPSSASRRIRHLHAVLQNRALLDTHPASGEPPMILPFLLLMASSVAGLLFASGAHPAIATSLSLVAFSYPAAFLLSNRRRALTVQTGR
jgi:hypothetical protein